MMFNLLALIGAVTVVRWLWKLCLLIFDDRSDDSGRYGHGFDLEVGRYNP